MEYLHILLEGFYQFIGLIGNQKTSHVLLCKWNCTHLDKDPCILHEFVKTVIWTGGIGKAPLSVSPSFLQALIARSTFLRSLRASNILDDINTIGNGFLYKIVHHIIGVMLVSYKVLASQEHLQICLFRLFPYLPETFPRDPRSKPQT